MFKEAFESGDGAHSSSHRSPPRSWRRGWCHRRPTASSWPIVWRHLRPPARSPSPGRAARAAAGRPHRKGLHSTLTRSLNSSPPELPAWRRTEKSLVCQISLTFVWFKRRREKTHQLKVSRWSSIRSCFSESVENSMFLPLNWTGVPENLATCCTRVLSDWGGTERRPMAAAKITWQQLLLGLLQLIYSDVHEFYGKTGLTGKEKMLGCQDATKYWSIIHF